MKYLWVRWWEGGGPRCKRFRFFEKSPSKMGKPRLTHGRKYAVLRVPSPHRGAPGAVELQIEEGADVKEVDLASFGWRLNMNKLDVLEAVKKIDVATS